MTHPSQISFKVSLNVRTETEPQSLGQTQLKTGQLTPICSEYLDKERRRLRLWESEYAGFIGTVIYPDGQLKLISSDRIINPMSNASSIEALQRIKTLGLRCWVLVFIESSQNLMLWPDLKAAGREGVPFAPRSSDVHCADRPWNAG